MTFEDVCRTALTWPPGLFYITEHRRHWPTVLVRLSRAPPAKVERLLFRQWARPGAEKGW